MLRASLDLHSLALSEVVLDICQYFARCLLPVAKYVFFLGDTLLWHA